MALSWQEVTTSEGGTNYRCEIRGGNGVDALFMEVHDRGRTLLKKEYTVSAYYWIEHQQRSIPLYVDVELRNRDDSTLALMQWYFKHAPTLLITLAP
ncbi:MAG: hypothetical protein OXI80_15195 [Caldilineaceae bacterium]|nr:hypothetical protein [Caldilineaceae bacterium]MDE0338823.1 hypothetical protein [Caldilineaceae bacterium]MDE0339015.1 hypothetical protein [Caldilineaceae bacterium]